MPAEPIENNAARQTNWRLRSIRRHDTAFASPDVGPALVGRRPLDVFDDKNIHRPLRGFQFQPKLFFEGREQRGCAISGLVSHL